MLINSLVVIAMIDHRNMALVDTVAGRWATSKAMKSRLKCNNLRCRCWNMARCAYLLLASSGGHRRRPMGVRCDWWVTGSYDGHWSSVVGIEAEWFVAEASVRRRSHVVKTEANAGCQSQVVGAGGKWWALEASGHRRQVIVVEAEWWVPELNGGCCSRVVGAGAVKHNNLCWNCWNMPPAVLSYGHE